MADEVLLTRVKRRLEEVWMATPKTADGDVWTVLAQAAVKEIRRQPEITERALPVTNFLVVQKPPRADGFRIVTQCESEAVARSAAVLHLSMEGSGSQVLIVEIKAALEAR